MKAVLLDTGCIVALLDRSEKKHAPCVEAVGQLRDTLVTCEAVVAESCHLLRSIDGAAEAVLDNISQGLFLLPFRLLDRASQVRKLMNKYRSVPMDLADACLVDLASQLGTGRILTLDRDFRVYRWEKSRAFEMLIDLDSPED